MKIKVSVDPDGAKDRGMNLVLAPWRVRSATGPVPTIEPGVIDGPASAVVVVGDSSVVVVDASSVIAVETSSVEVVPASVIEDVKVSVAEAEITVSVVEVGDSAETTGVSVTAVDTAVADDSALEVTTD